MAKSVSKQMYDAKCDEIEMCKAAMAGMMKVKPREATQ